MATPRSRSASSFIIILILSVVASALFAGVFGYFVGSRHLAGEFTPQQIEYIDGLVFGIQLKTEREEWEEEFSRKEVAGNDFRAFPGQRCAGKFFPDQPVAMKGCLAAQEPRPPKGYQFPI